MANTVGKVAPAGTQESFPANTGKTLGVGKGNREKGPRRKPYHFEVGPRTSLPMGSAQKQAKKDDPGSQAVFPFASFPVP